MGRTAFFKFWFLFMETTDTSYMLFFFFIFNVYFVTLTHTYVLHQHKSSKL